MLEFTLSLDGAVYSPGEAIAVKLMLRNSGPDPAVANTRLVLNSPLAPEPFRDVAMTVTDASGKVAIIAVIINVDALEAHNYQVLKPSETVERPVSIDLFYELERPGQYSVQAVYQSHGDPGDGRGAWKGELKSNVVTFTLEA